MGPSVPRLLPSAPGNTDRAGPGVQHTTLRRARPAILPRGRGRPPVHPGGGTPDRGEQGRPASAAGCLPARKPDVPRGARTPLRARDRPGPPGAHLAVRLPPSGRHLQRCPRHLRNHHRVRAPPAAPIIVSTGTGAAPAAAGPVRRSVSRPPGTLRPRRPTRSRTARTVSPPRPAGTPGMSAGSSTSGGFPWSGTSRSDRPRPLFPRLPLFTRPADPKEDIEP